MASAFAPYFPLSLSAAAGCLFAGDGGCAGVAVGVRGGFRSERRHAGLRGEPAKSHDHAGEQHAAAAVGGARHVSPERPRELPASPSFDCDSAFLVFLVVSSFFFSIFFFFLLSQLFSYFLVQLYVPLLIFEAQGLLSPPHPTSNPAVH